MSGASSEAWVWQGIILSSYAGAKGGLGALGLAKRARKSLEAALELDSSALDGSACTSLGAPYYQVPGFPIGFGSNKKAEEFLQKGLTLNPEGMDSNYFWGDYQNSRKHWEKARLAFQRALDAAPRAGREVADRGRGEEISAALAEVDEKLKSRS